MQSDGQLEKGQQHDFAIGDGEACNRIGEIVPGGKDDLCSLLRKLPDKKGYDARIIGIKEKGGYDGEEEGDKQIGKGGRKAGEQGYQMLGQGGYDTV